MKNINAIKRENFILKIQMLCLFGMFVAFVTYHIYFVNETLKIFGLKTNSSINVSYTNMNESEIQTAKKMMSEIKSQYYYNVNKIHFIMNDCIPNHCEALGLQQLDEIWIHYTGNYTDDQNTLQHELIHSIIKIQNRDTNEWVARDLSKKDCLK